MATALAERAAASAQFAGFDLSIYTQTPNELFALLPAIETMAELKVLLVAIRLTVGWHKGEDRISLSQMQRQTGLRKATCIAGLRRCVEHGYLERGGTGPNGTTYRLVVNEASAATAAQPSLKPVRQPYRPLKHNPFLDAPGTATVPLAGAATVPTKETSPKKDLPLSNDSGPAALAPHGAYFTELARLWGKPANDLEKGRYNTAAKQFRQAGLPLAEISVLKGRYERHWCGRRQNPVSPPQPLAIAANISALRALSDLPTPEGGGRPVDVCPAVVSRAAQYASRFQVLTAKTIEGANHGISRVCATQPLVARAT